MTYLLYHLSDPLLPAHVSVVNTWAAQLEETHVLYNAPPAGVRSSLLHDMRAIVTVFTHAQLRRRFPRVYAAGNDSRAPSKNYLVFHRIVYWFFSQHSPRARISARTDASSRNVRIWSVEKDAYFVGVYLQHTAA